MGDGKVALCDSIAVMPPSQFSTVLDVEEAAYLVEPTRRVMMSPDGVCDVSLLSIVGRRDTDARHKVKELLVGLPKSVFRPHSRRDSRNQHAVETEYLVLFPSCLNYRHR